MKPVQIWAIACGQWAKATGSSGVCRALLLALLAGAPAITWAQAAARDTERLQRIQRNLQQVQQERDAAKAETVALQRDQTAQAQVLETERLKIARLQAELRSYRDTGAQWQVRAEQMQNELAQARQMAATTAQAHANAQTLAESKLAQLQRELQGLRETNQNLVARLGASSAAQGELLRRNQQLYATSLEVLDLYRGADGVGAWAPMGGLLGLAQVQREDRAEQVRLRLDSLLAPVVRENLSQGPGEP